MKINASERYIITFPVGKWPPEAFSIALETLYSHLILIDVFANLLS